MTLLFAWRYFKARKTTNAINVIAWISIVAMVFGTTALILVLSVFNGFEGLVKSLYSSFYTDLKIFPVMGKTLTLTEEQINRIKGMEGVRGISLIAEERALLRNGEYQSLVNLKGVDENYGYVTDVPRFLYKGNFELGNEEFPSAVLGAGIENAIGVQTDRNLLPLTVYMGRRSDARLFDPVRDISSDTITTSGTFIIQQDFDNKYAITNIGFVKSMLELSEDEYSAAEIALHNPEDAESIQARVASYLGKDYSVQTRYQQNMGLYSVMQMEKWFIYAILCLILIVAAFNMIGALTMLVLEKEKDISVLHAMGASKKFIQGIFLLEGLLLAIIGGGVGMLLALILALLQINFELIRLPGGSFVINHFPVELRGLDFLLVGFTVFFISMLAAWIPSRKAAERDISLRSE